MSTETEYKTAREYADEQWNTSGLEDISEFTIPLTSAINMMEAYAEIKSKHRVEIQIAKMMAREPKCFTVSFVRKLENEIVKGEISYGKMIEIMNERAEEFHSKEES